MGKPLAAMAGILALSALALLALAGCGDATSARSAALPSAISCAPALRLFGSRPPPPRALATPLDAAVLARYELFRRTARPGDAPPHGGALAEGFTLARWYPAEMRALAPSSPGMRYYAFPAFGRPAPVPSGCRPASVRRELLAQQRRRLTELLGCLVVVGGTGSGPLACEPFAEIEAEADLFASGGQTNPLVLLVPDGVAALRISYRSRKPITVPATGNAIAFTPPPPSGRLRALRTRAERLSEEVGGCYRTGHGPWECGNPHLAKAQNRRIERRYRRAAAAYARAAAAAGPTQIHWLDSAGRVVRTLLPPTRAFLESVDVGDLRAPIGG